MIYLYDPINNIKTATNYEMLEGITGKTQGNLMSLKSRGQRIDNINCYIIDDSTPLSILRKMMQKVKIDGEIWKGIEGASLYEISDYGRIRRTFKTKTRILMPYIHHRNSPRGHRNKCLAIKIMYDNGKRSEEYIHQLVARHFLVNEEGLPCIYHKNENKFYNYAGNLEFVSREELGRRSAYKSKGKAVLKLDPVTFEVLDEYETMQEAAVANYSNRESIRMCANGVYKTAGGFKWIYDEGDVV